MRVVSADDLPWLIELRTRTMTAYLEASGIELSSEAHRDRVTHNYDAIRIIVCDGCDVGMAKVDRAPEIWKLIQIQILPEWQKRGIGTRIISEIVAEAGEASAGVELSVLKSNPAQELYRRMGFCVQGETEHSYKMRMSNISRQKRVGEEAATGTGGPRARPGPPHSAH